MFRKLIFLFITIPVAIVLILLSVANRAPVTFNLDPFNPEMPAYAFTLPLFVLMFGALIVGLILGSFVTWWRQGRHRKRARVEHVEVAKWKQQAEDQKKRADELAAELNPGLKGLPAANKAA
jgi:uncharacterized integral membrane protein